MNMALPLFGYSKRRFALLDNREEQLTCMHKEKIQTIVDARETADNLKEVLEKNHISIEIYKATGKKDVPQLPATRRTT